MKRLMDPKTQAVQQREQIKYGKELEEIKRHCTFKPAINERVALMEETAPQPRGYGPPMPRSARSMSSMSAQRVPIQDRLNNENEKRRMNREKIKRKADIESMKDCTFQPKTNDYNLIPKYPRMGQYPYAYENQLPIQARVDYVMKEKEDKLHRKRMEAEMAQKEELTFQPQVNERSKKMAELRASETLGPGMRRSNSFGPNRPSTATVTDRLYRDATDRMEKNLFANEYMNHGRSTMTAQVYNSSLKEFHERQAAFLKKKQDKKK